MATGQYRKPEAVAAAPTPIKYQYKTFSPNQWGMIRILKRREISNEESLFIDQRPFNSFCRRGFILKTREGYALSETGMRALDEYEHTDILKDHASDNLGKYVRMMATVRSMRKIA